MDLFDSDIAQKNKEPLASRMRPRNLDEYVGQEHIVGKGRLLRRAIQADQLTSVIFYGPPGTGKTTLARVIANHTKSNFITLNAVLTGVQNIRDAIAKAEEYKKLYNKKTILFVDEVHRWNKSQQDALLPWVENGTFVLIGATTENPFFEVNKALVSRSRVFQLKPLTNDDLHKAAMNAIKDRERGYGKWLIEFEDGSLEHLIQTANGDARSLLNALELAIETTPDEWKPYDTPCIPSEGSKIIITTETAEQSIQKKVVLYDRDGDYHYDIISAFIKSLRGRDPDAAMYWMARMLTAGEDPHFIFRRMIISACEDTGLADPYAISVVESCAQGFDRIGLPEGRFLLTHAALYLATAPKSNSSMCIFDVINAVEKEDVEVPNHLRDDSRDAEGFGHGQGYMYPHAYRGHWVAQQYLPDALVGRVFYNPSSQGYEDKIRQDVLSRRELQIASILNQDDDFMNEKGIPASTENLTFSPGDKKREEWQKRTETNKAQNLLEIRNSVMELAKVLRYHTNLIMNADDGLLLFELWRRTPEGFTCGICKNQKNKNVLEQYENTLENIDRPMLVLSKDELLDQKFDRIFYTNPISTKDSIKDFSKNILQDKEKLLSKDGFCVVNQKLPCKTQRLSELLEETFEDKELLIKMLEIENNFYSGKELSGINNDIFIDTTRSFFSWTVDDLKKEFPKNKIIEKQIIENRYIRQDDISKWFNIEKSIYANYLYSQLGKESFNKIEQSFNSLNKNILYPWKSTILLFKL